MPEYFGIRFNFQQVFQQWMPKWETEVGADVQTLRQVVPVLKWRLYYGKKH